jgi:transposase
MSRRKRKVYSREFKLEAVKLVTEQGYKARDAAERLGISASSISLWKTELKSETDQQSVFPGKGHLKPVDAEIKSLRKELEKTKRERDILKKAMAYFIPPQE